MEADLDRLRHDAAAWDAFVESTETDFPLQLSAWATAKAATGWQAERVVADGGSGPIGGQLLVRRLGPGPFAMGYLPRGPVARRFDAASVAAFTDALRQVARARRLTHVTADPGLEGNAHDALLAGAGWRRADALQLTSTQLIDLTRSEEELWSDVYKSSRRYANGARKRGCLVREGTEADLPVFYDILVETAERSGFIPRAFEAYRDVYRAFAAQGRALLLIGSLPDGTGRLEQAHPHLRRPRLAALRRSHGRRRRDPRGALLRVAGHRALQGRRCPGLRHVGPLDTRHRPLQAGLRRAGRGVRRDLGPGREPRRARARPARPSRPGLAGQAAARPGCRTRGGRDTHGATGGSSGAAAPDGAGRRPSDED